MPRCGMLVSRWGYLGSDGSIFVWSFVPQMVGLTPRGLCTLEGMGWHLCVELLKAQKKDLRYSGGPFIVPFSG